MASDLHNYSLDLINNFFKEHTTVTKIQCDEFASSLSKSTVNPTPIQGCFSYTLTAGLKQDEIIQFRPNTSLLDLELLELTRDVHGGFVPYCRFYGTIGDDLPLSVYLMNNLPGTAYVLAQDIYMDTSAESLLCRSNIVVDFARFFAQSWKHKQVKSAKFMNVTCQEYQQKLDILSDALPSRYSKTIQGVTANLQLLFAPAFPLVLTHSDLNEMNIFVDPTTGHLTGIIDWADATTSPFGTALWGVDNILGYMDGSGWHDYDSSDKLRKFFWITFKNLVGGLTETETFTIQVARLVGILLRYGFVWSEGGTRCTPITEAQSLMKYLDAFCLRYSRGTGK